MIQVLLCGEPTLEDKGLRETLQSCAASCGVELADIEESTSAIDAVDRVVHPGQKSLVDLVIADEDLPGLSAVQMMAEIQEAEQSVGCILLALSEDAAPGALKAGIGGFLLKSAAMADFEVVLERVLSQIARRHAESVEIRFRDRARRIDMYNIVYAETADHDQVIHLLNGKKHAVRCSSSVLFKQLEHDPRFFKAGSSSIVNLSHVRTVTTRGVVELSTGASVTVPMRLRKSLEDALLQFGVKE